MNIHRDIQIDTDIILNMFASKKEKRTKQIIIIIIIKKINKH
jgi:hypothetical protein